MSDTFNNYAFVPDSPANGAFAITPSDTVDLPRTTRGIYVGTAGDVAVVMRDGSSATFKNVPAGDVMAIAATRVTVTGTTAADLCGMY